ncbi:hypothetical protein M758_6G013000 [Ceratodon purpureus]|nr:hypothetical protein M758_6G013000 [Ceratodon purpureus]
MAMIRGRSTSAANTVRITPRGLFEVLPNLLKDKTALHFKHPELRSYINGLDERRFHDKLYLEGVKAHMEQHRLLFWKRLDVTITVEPGLSSSAARGKGVTANGVPQRVLDFFHSRPDKEGCICKIVEEGSNLKPWVMQCGDSVGVHGIKRVARMIAIIRRHIDPDFDPEGDSPAPPVKLSTTWSRSRDRKLKKRKLDEITHEMYSRKLESSPDYHDAEDQIVAHKAQRLSEVEETDK